MTRFLELSDSRLAAYTIILAFFGYILLRIKAVWFR